MKIFTLTTQYANNYGALLQCYALCDFLNSIEGVECKVIRYLPDGYNNSWRLIPKARTFRDVLKNIYLIFRLDLLIKRMRKQRVMKEFIKRFIPVTQEIYNRRNILSNPPVGDAFVCGSDQIWNFKYRIDLTYFFDFVDRTKSKIISYAPSIADPWTDEQCQFIKPYLGRFDAISIREAGNLSQVNELVPNMNPVVVIDPVFLICPEKWKTIASHKLCPKEPYILCYFLSVSQLGVKTVEHIRNLTGYKVLHLNLNALDKFHSDYDIRLASPLDFIGLIENASFVCTNSFHCSAFSIIFKRNFMFVPKNMANERVESLINKFKINDVIIREKDLTKIQLSDLNVDYSKSESYLNEFLTFSKDYINKAIFDGN